MVQKVRSIVEMKKEFFWLLYTIAVLNGATAANLTCYCENSRHCTGNSDPCTTENGTCFTRITEYGAYESACIDPASFQQHYYQRCLDNSGVLEEDFSTLFCCNNVSFCNMNFRPTLPPHLRPSTTDAEMTTSEMYSTAESGTGSMDPLFLGLTIAIPIFCVIFLTLVVVTSLVCILRHRKNRLEHNRRDHSPFNGVEPDATVELDEMTCTSGSGSGLPFLVQRTVARSIKLGEPIGSGRFGQVFIGEYHGEKVAVKKFASRDEQSWYREKEIYNTVLLRHENILGFFASDMVSNNGVTELWLITHYHANGSLYDYLNLESVTPSVLLRMIISICNGLSHLHTEIHGTMAKPAIAHRDIKSKNILVRNDLQCCIADFGLAVMKDLRGDSKINMPTNPRQGTKRYMAPEILSETMNMHHFDSFKWADIYALGLVIWEICRKCSDKNGISLEYEPPFHGLVPPDPSFDDMKMVVVVERRQPTIPNTWHQHELMKELTKLMRECWYFTNSARPTALYLKKKVLKLSQEIKVDHDEHE